MKIILIAYEVESFAMCRLAKLLEEDGHEAWVVNGDYYSFIDNTSIREYYRKHNLDRWVNFEQEYRKLYTTEYKVDWDYLKSFEKRFCKTKNLSQLIMTDPILSRSHHERRPYYSPIKQENLLYYWVELQLKWCESLIDKISPDIIFTIERNYFVKNAIWQIASAKGVRMLTLIHSRVNGTFYISNNFGYGTSNRIKAYLENDQDDSENLQEAKEYIKHFRDNLFSSIPDTPVKTLLEQKWLSSRQILRYFLRAIKEITIHGLTKKNRYRGRFKSNYFNSSTLMTILYICRYTLNKLRFKYFNPCQSGLCPEPFIYMPLHELPESSTLTLSTEYYEADLIRFISKELPAGMRLVVKEHPNMVGIRSFSFYSALKELPNVVLLDPRYSSKDAVTKSFGVTGISGTALLEAAMLERPTHCFGKPEFLDIIDFKDYSGFKDFIKQCGDNKPSINFKRTLRYVEYMLTNTIDLPLRDIFYRRKSSHFTKGLSVLYETLRSQLLQSV